MRTHTSKTLVNASLSAAGLALLWQAFKAPTIEHAVLYALTGAVLLVVSAIAQNTMND